MAEGGGLLMCLVVSRMLPSIPLGALFVNALAAPVQVLVPAENSCSLPVRCQIRCRIPVRKLKAAELAEAERAFLRVRPPEPIKAPFLGNISGHWPT